MIVKSVNLSFVQDGVFELQSGEESVQEGTGELFVQFEYGVIHQEFLFQVVFGKDTFGEIQRLQRVVQQACRLADGVIVVHVVCVRRYIGRDRSDVAADVTVFQLLVCRGWQRQYNHVGILRSGVVRGRGIVA